MLDQTDRLIAIIGPTASGKTDLAIDLAIKFGGEIVCADSRTIYREMNIGTAKPTVAEQRGVAHHLLNVASPGETFSAQAFQHQAEAAIRGIRARGKVPFLVGGTGLYVYSVLYDFQFPAGPRTNQRVVLEQLSLEELVEKLRQADPERADEIDLQNTRRVIRALETVGQPRQKKQNLPDSVLLLGLQPEKELLNKRITQRTERMFQIGLVREVQRLVARYGAEVEVLRSPGYAEVVDYLAGKSTLEEAQDLTALHTRQLVRRQLTWFRRNAEIRWLSDVTEVRPIIENFLA